MSYILDALKKLEEKDPRDGGGRLSGGGRPGSNRRRGAVAAAALLAVALVMVIALRRGEVGESPAEPAEGTTGKGAADQRTGNDPFGSQAADADDMPVPAVTGRKPDTPSSGNAARGELQPQESGPPSLEASFQGPEREDIRLEGIFGSLENGGGALPSAAEERKANEEMSPVDENEMLPSEAVHSLPEKGNEPLAGPEAERLYYLEELPRDIRSELGDLAMTGHIFSDDPSFRVVMIGDRVMKEGDTVSPGLVLKEITGDGAHFLYRGYLFIVDSL